MLLLGFDGLGRDLSEAAIARVASAVWTDASGVLALSDTSIVRKHTTNKAVISADDLTVTIYDDDGITPMHIFAVSTDKKTRQPA